MMTREQILEELDDMDAWKLRAMCASAAERAAPLFRRLGRSGTLSTFEAALDGAWDAIAAGGFEARTTITARTASRAKLARRLMREAKHDDSHRPDYYAGAALMVLVRALDYASTGDLDKAKDCLYEIDALCDGIDTRFTAAPGQTFMYDPQNPPPPGQLETTELRLQVEVLELLRKAPASDATLLKSLRQRARRDAAVYEAIVPQLTAFN
jgi:hypothetical protein